MHPDLEKLIPLQAMDLEAGKLREEMAAAPRRVAETEQRVQTAARRLADLRTELGKEDALRRRLESDIADQRQKRDRAQKKIDAATTTAQVTALEHEAEFARKEISRLEDTELESMERSETLEARLPPAESELRDLEQTLQRERDRSEQTVARDRTALVEVEQRRQALRAEIMISETGEASLSRYDRIAHHRGSAIAEAHLGKCTACGMMVRPQLWQDLRDNSDASPSHDQLFSCENCGRLLYYDPARDAPQKKPVQGESIAASIVRSL